MEIFKMIIYKENVKLFMMKIKIFMKLVNMKKVNLLVYIIYIWEIKNKQLSNTDLLFYLIQYIYKDFNELKKCINKFCVVINKL